ncbi:MAG TPA: phosphotransferase [Acidimicrobiales bacterium]|nr:phosphotransferase [Acidimicrobiales bacterium]
MLTLDADGLTKALHAAGTLDPSVRVTSVDPTSVGTGQMGDCRRLVLAYSGPTGAPATLVAKLPSSDETSRATGMAMRTYEVEVRFYQELAGRLPVRAPVCHHAEIDLATGDFVLLLEDLAPAEQGDQVAGCSPDAAAMVLEEAARLHAPLWGSPELTSFDWAVRWSPESQDQLQGLISVLWPNFVERYGEQLDDDVLAMGERFVAALPAYYAHRPEPHTVIHNDFRLDNLLFGTPEGGPPVAVVDWQTVGIGSALLDVSYFLGAGLSVEDRRTHEEALVRGYHEALLAGGVEGFDWERCWADYRAFAFAGFHMAVLASMVVQRTDRGDAMFLAMAGRHGRQILDLASESFLH